MNSHEVIKEDDEIEEMYEKKVPITNIKAQFNKKKFTI